MVIIMLDIWDFLLQTLTVSGVALLILLLKALFKDKLTPKWQFAVWSVLGIVMLIPAGMGGRYTLFRWQLVVEIVKSWFKDYSFTKVQFPIPAITSIPKTVVEWVFVIYVLGVFAHLIKYALSYFKLRRVVKLGKTPHVVRHCHIQRLEKEQGLKLYEVVEVDDLPSAFVYGIFRPVLVLPSCDELDDKIVLHELFHLKYKDTFWSVVICVLRSLHWCNPLIIYCADRALNDMESRCDQYVLETLEGEERREYGKILLSMANEKYSKTPGSTCINNGGKNIRARIENIARFKKYPQGMGLVSVCVIILLAFPLLIGVKASSLYEFNDSVSLNLASARATPCTTLAGAFDTYGQAILDQNGYYRAMCAPTGMQEDILDEMLENDERGISPLWDSGLAGVAEKRYGHYLYNLRQINDSTYEGLFVAVINYPLDSEQAVPEITELAAQKLRFEKEDSRWVVISLEDFRYVKTSITHIIGGCEDLPYVTYSGEAEGIRVEVMRQSVHLIYGDNSQNAFSSGKVTVNGPDPNADFSNVYTVQSTKCTYLSGEPKSGVFRLGVSVIPVTDKKVSPKELDFKMGDNAFGSTDVYTGEQQAFIPFVQKEGYFKIMASGSNSRKDTEEIKYPKYYAAYLYFGRKKVAELDLTLCEEE